jgi:hypothetical protein
MKELTPDEIETMRQARQAVAYPLGEAAGSAKFVLQRAEYPDWYAGKNMQGYACWTSEYGDAKFVRLDELVETMQWLAKEKPCATLHSPNLIFSLDKTI